MTKRKLTAAEIAAYRELAKAAAKLRRAQTRAERKRNRGRSEARQTGRRPQGVADA